MSVFQSVEQCIDLYKRGIPCDTGFSYMYNCEEILFDSTERYEFDLNADIKEQLDIIEEQGYAGPLVADDSTRPYDEFTQVICPAYETGWEEPQA